MGDHIVEYGKIFDYKDEILRSNPSSTCVVKVGEEDVIGQKIFQELVIISVLICGKSRAITNNDSGRGRCRGRGVSSPADVTTQSAVAVTHTEHINDRGRGIGRRRGICQERNVNESIDRGRGMPQHSQNSSKATGSGRGIKRGKRLVEHEDISGGQTRSFKRPRMVGIGIYQAEDGFTTFNPDLSSKRVINTSTRVTKRADVVTGDIGYTPRREFKWKGKTTIISSNLERMRAEKVIQIRCATATTNQSQTSSTRKTHVP
ncbi:uncharacterized protein LOC129903570 [Solanum dulcamara]|uniref:uncharacterized protein LOC129903570 n=1 Tax=Solanum dulcamara TaxID=45834 RepID=UPI002485830C|nr:uncharacterized protein LOC129903570 [Solanum dulcamara]